MLRCGGSVTWSNGKFYLPLTVRNNMLSNTPHPGSSVHDYNTLPVGNYRQLKVAAIDGTDSCIMEHG